MQSPTLKDEESPNRGALHQRTLPATAARNKEHQIQVVLMGRAIDLGAGHGLLGCTVGRVSLLRLSRLDKPDRLLGLFASHRKIRRPRSLDRI